METLDELEEFYGKAAQEQLQDATQRTLNSNRPLCTTCDLMMHRQGSYPRTLLARLGVLQVRVPFFRCPQCHKVKSGIEALGMEQRHRFSKKLGRKPSA